MIGTKSPRQNLSADDALHTYIESQHIEVKGQSSDSDRNRQTNARLFLFCLCPLSFFLSFRFIFFIVAASLIFYVFTVITLIVLYQQLLHSSAAAILLHSPRWSFTPLSHDNSIPNSPFFALFIRKVIISDT